MIDENLLEGNKYFKWYWSICNRAKDRILSPDIYTEKHHIYPKSIYGENNNIVILTLREHYLVHKILWFGLKLKYGYYDKLTLKMAFAFNFISIGNKEYLPYRIKSSKDYEMLRIANREALNAYWENKENREQQSLRLKKYYSDSNNRNKQGLKNKEYYSDLNNRKQTNENKEYWENAEKHLIHAELSKNMWQNEEYRKKQCDERKKRWDNPEYKMKRKEEAKKRWSDPEYRKKQMESRNKKS